MSVNPNRQERLIASIYDAAVDGRIWDETLIALADATGCLQATLEIFDAHSGLIRRYAPLCAEEYRQSYRQYWGRHFCLWRRTDRFPVGRLLRSADIMDTEAAQKTAYYNEWWRPQGTGGDGRYSNLVADGRATALVAAFKPFRRPSFRADDDRLFGVAVRHLIRAVEIHRRLAMAEAQRTLTGAGQAPAGFVILDDRARILGGDPSTCERLAGAGLIADCSLGHAGQASALQRLVAGACGSGRAGPGIGPQTPRAGRVEHSGRDGSRLDIRVVPLRERDDEASPWLAIDRPAALLYVSAPKDAARERAASFAAHYGLTEAESAVAMEAAKGDGRAAVAARLGIRETTVRSHLSAIFDKLGIHRQAELTRIVMEA